MKKLCLIIAILSAYTGINAQPGWSVNSSNFENSMNIVAVMVLDGVESTSDENMIAAFVGGEVRGVATTSVETSTNRKVAFLQIYSNVSTGETITFKLYDADADAEIESVVSISFSNDGIVGTSSDPFPITNNGSPSNIDLDVSSFSESTTEGFVIGKFSTEDPDDGESFVYSLVGGEGDDDNTSFSISGDELILDSSFDYEMSADISIRVQSTDSRNGSHSEQFDLTVTDANDAPTDITLSNTTFNENVALGTVFGDLTTTDQDENETFSYSLVAGTGSDDNYKFTIDESQIKIAGSVNFEDQNSFSVLIQSEDSEGAVVSEIFALNAIDRNDVPTQITLNPDNFDENLVVGTPISDLISTDEDATDSPTFSFTNTGSNDNEHFTILGNQLLTKSAFDYENRSIYFVGIEVDDGNGGVLEQQLSINVIDKNDTPTAIETSNVGIDENLAVGSRAAIFSTTDQDESDTFIYSLVTGTGSDDNSDFQIVDNELLSNVEFDFESKEAYNVRIQSEDNGGAIIEKSFTIQIEDKNDAPTDILITSGEIFEESPSNTSIGQFSATDEDIGDTFIYTLVEGEGDNDNAEFAIDGNNLISQSVFDAESKTAYSVRIKVEDSGGNTFSKSFDIAILALNEVPKIIDQEFYVTERSQPGTLVGTVEASDVEGDLLDFSILDSNVPFGIDVSSGEISVSEDKIDYEDANLYVFEVQVTDPEGLSDTATIRIIVEDVIESELALPVNNFISANNDGFNDTFEIQNVSLYQDYTLTIFNNVGSSVYSATGYSNDWSGTDNAGNDLTSGAYYYSFISPTNPVSFKGSLVLIR